MVPGRERSAITKLSSVQNKQGVTIYDTFEWVPVVSTNRQARSSWRRLILCFDGTAMQPDAMYTYQMFRSPTFHRTTTNPNSHGSRLFKEVDGLPGAGHSRNFLPRHR